MSPINPSHAAAAALSQLIYELDLDIILIHEPYVNRTTKDISDVPAGYRFFHQLTDDHQFGAAIIYKSNLAVKPISHHSSNEIAGIELICRNKKTSFYSIYCRPSAETTTIMNQILTRQDFATRRNNCIIGTDANARNQLWNSSSTDRKGSELEHLLIRNELNVCNKHRSRLNFVPSGTSFIDVTIMGDSVFRKLKDWRFLSTPSLSDHFYIYFTIDLQPSKRRTTERPLPPISKINLDKCKHSIREQLLVPSEQRRNSTLAALRTKNCHLFPEEEQLAWSRWNHIRTHSRITRRNNHTTTSHN